MSIFDNFKKYWFVYFLFAFFLFNIFDPSLCFAGDYKPQDIIDSKGKDVDTGFLDTLLNQILDLCKLEALDKIQGYSGSVLDKLMFFDLFLAVFFGLIAFDGSPNFLTIYMTKILKYGFWIYVIQKWDYLVTVVNDSLIIVGASSGASKDIALHPSKVLDLGFTYAKSFWDFATTTTCDIAIGVPFINVGCIILGIIGAVVTFLAFAHLTISVFLTSAEFYICSTLSLIFVPFAVFDKTERFSSQAISLTISAGVKMMVYTFLLGFYFKLLEKESAVQGLFAFKDRGILTTILGIVLVFILLYLAINASSLASSIVSGALSFTAGSAIASAKSAGGTISKGGAALAGGGVRAGENLAKAASTIFGGAGQAASEAWETGKTNGKGALPSAYEAYKDKVKENIDNFNIEDAKTMGRELAKAPFSLVGGTIMGGLQATIGGRGEGLEVFRAAMGSRAKNKNKNKNKDGSSDDFSTSSAQNGNSNASTASNTQNFDSADKK